MKPSPRPALRLEGLESRLVPASVLHYRDTDGDAVTVTASAGNLAGRATLNNIGLGQQLASLNLTDPSFTARTSASRR